MFITVTGGIRHFLLFVQPFTLGLASFRRDKVTYGFLEIYDRDAERKRKES